MKKDQKKQIEKLEEDLKSRFSQKLKANNDLLEKRIEDTNFSNKESQCQIEENVEKISTKLAQLTRELLNKDDKENIEKISAKLA